MVLQAARRMLQPAIMRHTTEPPSERLRAIMRAVSQIPQHHLVDLDPEDPSQQLDDLGGVYVGPLAVEAQPLGEAAEELDAAAAENEGDPEQDEADSTLDERGHDPGELHGLRPPHAGDANLATAEARGEFAGETWIETLEGQAIELGPLPEEEIVIDDERDLEHHPTERGDRPVADKGSGGLGGL